MHLAELMGLQSLVLDGCTNIRDDGAAWIADAAYCTTLQAVGTVRLWKNALTLSHVQLDISQTGIEDAGFLKIGKACPNLTHLRAVGCWISYQARSDYQHHRQDRTQQVPAIPLGMTWTINPL